MFLSIFLIILINNSDVYVKTTPTVTGRYIVRALERNLLQIFCATAGGFSGVSAIFRGWVRIMDMISSVFNKHRRHLLNIVDI